MVGIFVLFISAEGSAQRAVTYTEAEQALQKNNLLLLAEKYNISASKAAVIQARIWEQPYLSGEVNVIHPDENSSIKIFDVGANGQAAISIQQLIHFGGQKNNEANFAESNVTIAELQFEQLLRNLKYQLSQKFYSLYYDKQKINRIHFQINRLDTLVKSYEMQASKGNIAFKEVVRLQALLIGLRNDKILIQREVIVQQQEIQLITGINEPNPIVNESELNKFNAPKFSRTALIDSAVAKNPEYLAAVRTLENQELYLRWQKSLAIPDITLGLTYDQNGGAFKNQLNLTIGIPLPFWNKNEGNIKVAESQLNQSMLIRDYKKSEIKSRIETAWLLWEEQQKQLGSISKAMIENFESVYQGIINNFQKRNISLMEFTDFIESYNNGTIQLSEIKKQWILASLSLNYLTNMEVF